MKINSAGLGLIKLFEGCKLNVYLDIAGIPTIGYGHTGSDVRMGMTISPEEAENLLKRDLERFEEGVSRSLGGAKTTENQFSAMISLAYNIGLGAFKSSSVLRFHRDEKPQSAAQSFLLWNKATIGGELKPVAGLTRRRQAERTLYLRGLT